MLKISHNQSFQDACVGIVQSGDLKALANLLAVKKKSEMNAPVTRMGLTLLHLCAVHGQAELAMWLITKGARADVAKSFSRKTPLHIAAYYGHLHVFNALREHCPYRADRAGCLPIHYASMAGHVDIVKQAIATGSSALDFSDIGTPLDIAIRKSNSTLLKFLLSTLDEKDLSEHSRAKDGLSLFHLAVIVGKQETLDLLFDRFPQLPKAISASKWAENEDAAIFFLPKGRETFVDYFCDIEDALKIRERLNIWINQQKARLSGFGLVSEVFFAVLETDLLSIQKITTQAGLEILTTKIDNCSPIEIAMRLHWGPFFDWLIRIRFFSTIPMTQCFFMRWYLMDVNPMSGGFFNRISKEIEVLTLSYHVMQGDS